MALRYTWWFIFLNHQERFFDSPSNSRNCRPPMPLSSQTRKRRSTSRNLALIYWRNWWKILCQCYRCKIMQWNWLFWFVAVRWNSQIIKREERDRMQHRKLRLCGCSYQTEGITIFWIYRQPRDILSEHNKRRTPCSICYNHHRSIKGTRCIFFRSKS